MLLLFYYSIFMFIKLKCNYANILVQYKLKLFWSCSLWIGPSKRKISISHAKSISRRRKSIRKPVAVHCCACTYSSLDWLPFCHCSAFFCLNIFFFISLFALYWFLYVSFFYHFTVVLLHIWYIIEFRYLVT